MKYNRHETEDQASKAIPSGFKFDLMAKNQRRDVLCCGRGMEKTICLTEVRGMENRLRLLEDRKLEKEPCFIEIG